MEADRKTLVAIIERMAHQLDVTTGLAYATRGGARRNARSKMPRAGDFVMVQFICAPTEKRIGWIEVITPGANEYLTAYSVRGLDGTLCSFSNVRVMVIPLGDWLSTDPDPAAEFGSFVFHPERTATRAVLDTAFAFLRTGTAARFDSIEA